MRQNQVVNGQVCHVMNKSIAGYQIFNTPTDYGYFIKALRYFALPEVPTKLSYFLKKNPGVKENGFEATISGLEKRQPKRVRVIAYAVMPTHFHLLAEQRQEGSLTAMIRNTLNAYARYFNIKHERKGPLWVGPFKNVPVDEDGLFAHVTRYIHLNPVTAGLCRKAEKWPYSSYLEYVDRRAVAYPVTDFEGLLDIKPGEYRKFCEDRAAYQKELAMIKAEALD